MSEFIRVLIVDDVELARQKMRRALSEHSDVVIVGEAADAVSMQEAIASLKPTLIFLDISMPEQDGFSALADIDEKQRPLVIFVTAYAQFALQAFRVEAIDYLLKPADPALLAIALDRVRRRLAQPDASSISTEQHLRSVPTPANTTVAYPQRLNLRTDSGIRVLPVMSIDWIESIRNYVAVHSGTETLIVRSTLQGILAQLDPACFARVHRSTIVNIKQIRELQPLHNGDQRMLLQTGSAITISRTYRDTLLQLLAK